VSWQRVTREHPCPICGKPDWCTVASDGRAACCMRVRSDALEDLGVGIVEGAELRALRARWDGEPPTWAWTFAERSADGHIVSLSLRAPDRRKSCPAGSKRGLIVPQTLSNLPDPVVVCEGASDCAALLSVGVACVGGPSNAGGASDLAALLEGRNVLVIGERDQKAGGAWPRRDGARAIARRLANAWREPVRWALPPAGAKDILAWLAQRITAGLDLTNIEACRAACRARSTGAVRFTGTKACHDSRSVATKCTMPDCAALFLCRHRSGPVL